MCENHFNLEKDQRLPTALSYTQLKRGGTYNISYCGFHPYLTRYSLSYLKERFTLAR